MNQAGAGLGEKRGTKGHPLVPAGLGQVCGPQRLRPSLATTLAPARPLVGPQGQRYGEGPVLGTSWGSLSISFSLEFSAAA